MADDQPNIDVTADATPVSETTPSVETTTTDTAEPTQEPRTEHAPSWLDEGGAEPQAPPPQAPNYPQQQQWQPPPPQWQPQAPPWAPQQPQMPPQPSPEDRVQQLLTDPDGYFSQLNNPRDAAVNQQMSQLAYQYQNLQAQTAQWMQAQTAQAVAEADTAITTNYKEVLNKDEAFAVNKTVKDQVETSLKRLYNDGRAKAANGDHSILNMFKNPRFYRTVLNVAKDFVGYKPSAKELEDIGRMAVESSSPQRNAQGAAIPEDVREVLRRSGVEGAEEAYIKNTTQHGERNIWPD